MLATPRRKAKKPLQRAAEALVHRGPGLAAEGAPARGTHGRGIGQRLTGWLGRDRRDHELHQHVEPLGDAGRRPAGEEGRRPGASDQALGEGEPRARVEGGDRLPQGRRRRRRPRRPPLQPGRLRLHDLHRQLRAAPQRRSPRRSRTRPGGGGGAERATATSRGGSIPTSGPTISPHRRWSSPTRWPAPWTSTSATEPIGIDRQGSAGLPQGHLADPAGDPGRGR